MRPRKYTRINSEEVDYKDLNLLRRFLSDKGKTRGRRVTGLSRKHQRQLAVAGQAGARDRAAAVRRGEVGAPMAQAVLLEDVEKLGRRGDPIDVAPGYLRNFLIPRKLAMPATPGALEEAQRRRDASEKAERERTAREVEAASLLSKTVLTIYQRAGEDGKLFGSVGPKEIVGAIEDARDLRIDHRKVRLEQPLREIGTHMVEIELADGTVASVKTIITEEK